MPVRCMRVEKLPGMIVNLTTHKSKFLQAGAEEETNMRMNSIYRSPKNSSPRRFLVNLHSNLTKKSVAGPSLLIQLISHRHHQPAFLQDASFRRSCVFNVLGFFFLLPSTSNTRLLHVSNPTCFLRNGTNVLLRSTSLERGLASLKVASVVFRTEEGEDNNVRGNTSDEDALNERIVRHVFWALRSLNRRA